MYGRPGACYVDISGDMVNAKVNRSNVRFVGVFTFRIVSYIVALFLCSSRFVCESTKEMLFFSVLAELCPAVHLLL